MQEITNIEMPPPEKKQSGLGIASFVIAMVTGIVTFVAVVFAGILASQNSENEIGLMIVGLMIIGAVLVHLLGLVLGIIGLTQKNTKKVFSSLGLAFNFLAVSFIGLLMFIGLAVS